MNNINLFSQLNVFSFKSISSFTSAITPLQKKITIIAVFALCLFVTCYCFIKNLNLKHKKIVNDPLKNNTPKIPQLDLDVLSPPKKPDSQIINKQKEPETPKKPKESAILVPPIQEEQKEPVVEIKLDVAPNHEIKETTLLIDANLEDGLSTFLKSVQLLAPTFNRPLICTIANVNYVMWWNSSIQAVNVQKEENFYHQTMSKRQEEKLGIRETNGKFYYYRDGKPSIAGISQAQIELLTALLPEVAAVQTKSDEMKDLENKFNPECLQLLLSFLKGPNGIPYRYDSQMAFESPKQLGFGKNPKIVAWMRVDETPQNFRLPSEKKYIINLQTLENYKISSPKEKLGIRIDDNGLILSIYIDGKPSDASALFSANEVWNNRLTAGINAFLGTKALSLVHDDLALHALTLSQLPEVVLDLLCKNGSFKIPDHVDFLKQTLEPGLGLDAGGLTRQLLSDLPRYLLDGSDTRAIEISTNGLPKLSDLSDSKKVQALTNLGRMLSNSFQSNGNFVIGRMMPDHYFGLIKQVLTMTLPMTNEQIINACQHIVRDDNKWMWEVWKTGRELSDQEVDTMVNILCLTDESDNPDDFESPGVLKKASAKKIIGDYLLSLYKDEVLAAFVLSREFNDQQKTEIKNLSNVAFSKRIQGEPFSRDDIVNRVSCSTTHPVILQKMGWLKEFIRTQPEEWVLKLLSTVTGERTVTAQTRIHLVPLSGGTNCHAHTCFRSLDVPTEHVNIGTDQGVIANDKQKFLNNLELTMSQDGFDMS